MKHAHDVVLQSHAYFILFLQCITFF